MLYAFLCCVFHGTSFIAYVQVTILNLPRPYLRIRLYYFITDETEKCPCFFKDSLLVRTVYTLCISMAGLDCKKHSVPITKYSHPYLIALNSPFSVVNKGCKYFVVSTECFLQSRFIYSLVPRRSDSSLEEEHLVHTVVCMRLISEKSQKIGYPGNFLCNGDVQPQY